MKEVLEFAFITIVIPVVMCTIAVLVATWITLL